jgi:hypothetical protein
MLADGNRIIKTVAMTFVDFISLFFGHFKQINLAEIIIESVIEIDFIKNLHRVSQRRHRDTQS